MSQNPELDLRDVDADVLLIADYFGGELSPREAAGVESRVLDDDEFFAKVGLLIEATLLQSSLPHRGMRAVLAERHARVAEDLLAMRVSRSLWPDIDDRLAEPASGAIAPTKAGRSSVAPIEPPNSGSDGQTRWRRYVGIARRSAERLAAAALILSVMTNFGLALKLRSVLAGLDEGPMPQATVSTGRVSVTMVVDVPANVPAQVLDFPNGARATVMPGTRLSYDTVLTVGSVKVTLDGEASFEVPGQASLGVFTRAGATTLSGGAFAMRSSRGDSETLITVSRGRAVAIRTNAPPGEELEVTSGFARLTHGQKPAVVTQGTDKFPRIPPR